MQVKFRGKRKGGNEWLIGDLNHIQGGVFIFPRENATLNSPDWFEVEPSSIGMFTGLTDKNGKEIYGAVGENGGDIIRNLSDADYEVMYFKDVASFIAHDKGNFNELLFAVYSPFTEIIGNAFDNPELLEK